MNTWGNCKELFWIGNILVFLDTTTDYIWVYDYANNNPIHIFRFYKTIKQILKGDF